MPIPIRFRVLVVLSLVLLPLAACGGGSVPSNQASAQLSFGVDMARRGLWDEALFRFEEAAKLDPNNPRIQSNLGVAHEAAGEFDQALKYYQSALRLAPTDREIKANYARFVEFYQSFKPQTGGNPAGTSPATPPGQAPSPPEDTPPPPADDSEGRPPL